MSKTSRRPTAHPLALREVEVVRVVDLPRKPRPLSKVCTVRRRDPEAGELDVDFVRHGIGVDRGVVTGWNRERC
ncbi:siderophore-interacting protein [Umezawaea sp. Da 62-37]|uniref:siderophore-interacting protein n=1 Tax=Umezawaea sp. Da 62-37 TaxID=3075927 RepID=UPI0028F73B66|nr:siderophore-interacting protein [Umezawaea sp. Da 62-37]WNV85299.1 siderophore-interacting protein [Umezawaea sp. Da 62-37]